MNWYFIIASGLLGFHNYAALMAHGQRLKWVWHSIQWLCIGLYVYSGYIGWMQYLSGLDLWIILAVNISAGGITYNVVLHGLKLIKFKIPKWFKNES